MKMIGSFGWVAWDLITPVAWLDFLILIILNSRSLRKRPVILRGQCISNVTSGPFWTDSYTVSADPFCPARAACARPIRIDIVIKIHQFLHIKMHMPFRRGTR